MATLVRDVMRRVLADLQDEDPYFERWPEQFMVDLLSDAQLIIARFLPSACINDHAIRLLPGTRQSIANIPAARIKINGVTATADAQGISPVAFHHTMGTDGETPGRPLRVVSRQLQDTHNPGWHTTVGEYPDEIMTDPMQPGVFWVCPGVSAAVQAWIQMAYTAMPADIPPPSAAGVYAPGGSSTQIISLADEYREDLGNYMVARACMVDGKNADPAKAQTFSALFLQSISQKIQALTGTSPNLKRLPMNVSEIGGSK